VDQGHKAPHFALADQDGRVHHLQDYQGRPVLLLFFGELDAEAQQSLRSLRQSIRAFDEGGIRVFTVGRGDAPAYRQFHDAERLPFPILVDREGALAARYGLSRRKQAAARGAFIIGPKGTVLQRVGYLQPERLGEQLSVLASCCLAPTQGEFTKAVGKQLAEFPLPRVTDGKRQALFGPEPRSATLVLFLSARCPCSRGYDERIRRIAEEYAPQGLRTVAVFSGADESDAEITQHAREAGYPFPLFRDPGNEFADRCAAKITPEAFLLDTKRVVRYHGRIDDSRVDAEVRTHDLRNALDALLAGHLPLKPEVRSFGCAISRVQSAESP
jgi:peroxiredoxin